jgi:IS30 family transposase
MSRVLTARQKALVPQIVELKAQRWKGRQIADKLGTSPATVSRILCRLRVETWLREAHKEMQRLNGGDEGNSQVLPRPFPSGAVTR